MPEGTFGGWGDGVDRGGWFGRCLNTGDEAQREERGCLKCTSCEFSGLI